MNTMDSNWNDGDSGLLTENTLREFFITLVEGFIQNCCLKKVKNV